MKAPIYQRAEMFEAVIGRAVRSLRDPIDSIALVDGRFVVRAGARQLVFDCVWENGRTDGGEPLLGSGRWNARPEADDEDTYFLDDSSEKPFQPTRRPWLWRIFGNWSRPW